MLSRSLTKLGSKRKKSALLLMEKHLMTRLSDYFSWWKLKVLLEKGQSMVSHVDQSLQ